MATFHYKAKKGPLDLIEGEIDADSKLSAVSKLNSMGLFQTSVSEKEHTDTDNKITLPHSGRIRPKDMAIFMRQLSDLMDAGLTLIGALDVVGRQTTTLALKKISAGVIDQIKAGATFSDSLMKYPEAFRDLHINIIRAGEAGGALGQVLTRLADLSEKEDDIRTKVRAALIYPLFLSLMGIITITVLLTFVIPKLLPIFTDLGQKLPWPTRVLLFISDTIVNFWWLFAGALVVTFFIFKRKLETPEGKKAFDNFKLQIPVIGIIIKKSEIARFTRTLGSLLTNGIPIIQSIKIAGQSTNNAIIKDEIGIIHGDIEKGAQLGETLGKCPTFPPFAVNMISVGEHGGMLEQSLLKVADSLDKEIDRQIKSLTVILEPAMILTMGLIIGFIVIAMLLPIFEINLAVQ